MSEGLGAISICLPERQVLGLEAKADMRQIITLACTQCKRRNYSTEKNKKNDPNRLELKKYCPFCKTHVLHKESR